MPEAGSVSAENTPIPKASAPERTEPLVQEIEQLGVVVKCIVTPKTDREDLGTIHAGDDVEVRFEISDTTTGSPWANLSPAAWIHEQPADGTGTCERKIGSFLEGTLSTQAEFDLNVFYVLALNEDSSITVVDPLFSYGGTRLLAMIRLSSPGEDWLLNPDQRYLYVTTPLVNQVAVIDTASWEVIHRIDVGVQPTRIRLQPDGKYLWVSCVSISADGSHGEVVVIDAETWQVTERISIGSGHHDVAFSADSIHAYVSNDETATLTIVDVQTLKSIRSMDVGKSAGGLVYSPVSQCAYVVDGATGTVVAVDGRSHEVVARIAAEPGLGTIRLAPGGRFVFVANMLEDTVDVIDVASNKLIQTADVGPQPDQISFSLNMAYVRSRGSELILMIPLDHVGGNGRLSVVDFSGGFAPFGLSANRSLADGIAQGPSGVAVVVGNPVDKAIYYYREGMAAPMGEFSNYGREPRAVLVVDRSLHETSPGVYTTRVNLNRSGSFDLAFLLDSPRVIHCFDLQVEDAPGSPARQHANAVRIKPNADRREVTVGETVTLRFEVTDSATGEPRGGIQDVGVVAFTPENWQQRYWATDVKDGVYEVTFVPPHAGVYYTFCQIPSLSMQYRDSPSLVVTAVAKQKMQETVRGAQP